MMEWKGAGVSSGIGMGRAVVLGGELPDYSSRPYAGLEQERRRLEQALEHFTAKLDILAEATRQRLGDQAGDILIGQGAMAGDPGFRQAMEEELQAGRTAEAAIDGVCRQYGALFSQTGDELLRQRASDLEDIRQRLLAFLLRTEGPELDALPPDTVLVVKDLTPSVTARLDPSKVAAILSETGGQTSHAAILARGLEIPAVLGLTGISSILRSGQAVIVDGGSGLVVADPTEFQLKEYSRLRQKGDAERQVLEEFRTRPTRTADGRACAVFANISAAKEALRAAEQGAEGIGLFRTEFLFLDRDAPPSEEEQYDAYVRTAEAMGEKPVVIRTLDVGGDKPVKYLGLGEEENPFLGYRAIRYCLEHPKVFSCQLRAILRAGAVRHNIKILLPLVTGVEEIRGFQRLLERCKASLAEEEMPFDPRPEIGIMIETPAAVQLASRLAREVSFFSIGTNDLTQYTLAVDRGNARVRSLYSPLHPAVLRSIRQVITAGHQAGIPVGMCGEACADARMIPLLTAWELDEFSVSPAAVPAVRRAISIWSRETAAELAEQALCLDSAVAVEQYLYRHVKRRETQCRVPAQ